MIFSVIVDGQVVDIKYKRRSQDTLIKLGDLTIGQLFKSRRGYWSIVVLGDIGSKIRTVHGFSTRTDATIYALTALEIEGYGNEQD